MAHPAQIPVSILALDWMMVKGPLCVWLDVKPSTQLIFALPLFIWECDPKESIVVQIKKKKSNKNKRHEVIKQKEWALLWLRNCPVIQDNSGQPPALPYNTSVTLAK